MIQTFGYKDTVLELYTHDGAFIKSSDDEGYENNALISHEFSSNTQYKVKVKFYRPISIGEIKLVILPSDSYTNYKDINGFEYGSIYTNVNLPVNKVKLFTYIPYNTQQYNITTDLATLVNEYYDTYLYVIDPRSTTPISNNFEKPSVYNDDGGDNFQARIVKSLTSNVPYLIIVSTYNITVSNSRFMFIISNQIN